MLTDLHTFGFNKENTLKERIEAAVGESILKTQERYAKFDYHSDNFYIELKSRRATTKGGYPLLPETNDTWLLPTSKAPEDDEKEAVYFYYYEADNSLWYILYDRELFETFHRESPLWHPGRQEHWYIPKDAFTKIE